MAAMTADYDQIGTFLFGYAMNFTFRASKDEMLAFCGHI